MSDDSLAALLLPLGQPAHPHLDTAIVNGDHDQVLAELATIRAQYTDSYVTLNTALDCAISCHNLGILDLLIAYGIRADDNNLQKAIAGSDIPIVARLLDELPGTINMVFDNGRTTLTLAVHDVNMVRWLLSQQADPNLQDAWSETPLSRAIAYDSDPVIEVLLDAGADVRRGAPIHMALSIDKEEKSLRLIARLLSLGAPVDQVQGENSWAWDMAGYERGTALHSASAKGKLSAVRLLLAHGANPLYKQKSRGTELAQSTALDEARDHNCAQVVLVLQEHLRG